MRYLSLIELPRLSHFQKSALGTYGERWSALRRSTTPVDREEAALVIHARRHESRFEALQAGKRRSPTTEVISLPCRHGRVS